MLGPDESVHVVIYEPAYLFIFGRQDKFDEPGVIGKESVAEPENIIIGAARLR